MVENNKIILINQKPEVLKVMKKLQLQIIEADNCIDGIRKIIRFDPHLVIVEIDSPNLNGFTMARILLLLQIKTPLILTGQSKKNAPKIESFSNIVTLIHHKDVQFDLGKVITKTLNDTQVIQSEYPYNFKQREWADLFSQSERKRILVVAKEEDSLKSTLMNLDRPNNYELYSARDGLEGLLKAILIKPDLILSDIALPTLGGMVMSQIFFILNKPYPFVFIIPEEEPKILGRIKKNESVVGVILKTTLKDSDTLVGQIDQFLRQSKNLKQRMEESYHKGEMKTLLKSDDMPLVKAQAIKKPVRGVHSKSI